jgi:hypothetical protein
MTTSTSHADRLALALWDRRLEQLESAGEFTGDAKEREILYEKAWATEKELKDEIQTSVLALAAVLLIEISREETFVANVEGLHLASLAALRPQLVGSIAEAADRVLARLGPDPVLALVKQVRSAWDRLGEAIRQAGEDEDEGIISPAQRMLDAAMDSFSRHPRLPSPAPSRPSRGLSSMTSLMFQRQAVATCERWSARRSLPSKGRAHDRRSPTAVSLNLKRRHLDESQRALAAAKLATLGQGARTDLSPIGDKSQSLVRPPMGFCELFAKTSRSALAARRWPLPSSRLLSICPLWAD